MSVTAAPATNSKPTALSRLSNRDFTLMIDKSASMSYTDVKGFRDRWHAVQETTKGIARKLDQYDPDGITLYTFSGGFKRYDNVTPSKVDQVFAENEPCGSTNLHLALADAFSHWKKRKASGDLKGGETIVIITDGEPTDEEAVVKEIKAVTKVMDNDEELAIAVFQIGQDTGAKAYLQRLDDALPDEGAKFDVVDTKTFEQLESGEVSITEALIAAIDD